jgi:hypothetical protein
VNLPCQYCGRPVDDAEGFFKLGVWPCCFACRRWPLVLGIGWLVFSVAIAVLGVLLWRVLPES